MSMPEHWLPVFSCDVDDPSLVDLLMDALYRFLPSITRLNDAIGQRYLRAIRLTFYVEEEDTSEDSDSDASDPISTSSLSSLTSDDTTDPILMSMDEAARY